MFEIRCHGRGGQGARFLSLLIGRAGFLSGYHVQDFPLYGSERRGAPMQSFIRLSSEPILTRGYVHNPDFVIILDDSLDTKAILGDCKESVAIINTTRPKTSFKAKKVYTLDATELALQNIGKPIMSTVMLGAFAKVFKKLPMKNLEKAIELELSEKKELMHKNKEACVAGFKAV